MKAPLTRLAVVAFSLALIGSMAVSTHATGTSSNNTSSNNTSSNNTANNSQSGQTAPSGCCGPSQPSQGQ